MAVVGGELWESFEHASVWAGGAAGGGARAAPGGGVAGVRCAGGGFYGVGGTEADNAGIQGVLAGARDGAGAGDCDEFGGSIVRCERRVARLAKAGREVVEIGVDEKGALDVAGLEGVLKERGAEIALVTIMWVNNETGVVFDIGRIGEICRRAGVVFQVGWSAGGGEDRVGACRDAGGFDECERA